MSHNPADNCFNTTAIQYRFPPTGVVDDFGGNVNSSERRVRPDDEPLPGFRCGIYPNEAADRQIAGGPANVDSYTMYCNPRDIRQQDYVTSPLYPGRRMVVETVRQHGGVGQITPFMVCTLSSVRNQAVATANSPGVL